MHPFDLGALQREQWVATLRRGAGGGRDDEEGAAAAKEFGAGSLDGGSGSGSEEGSEEGSGSIGDEGAASSGGSGGGGEQQAVEHAPAGLGELRQLRQRLAAVGVLQEGGAVAGVAAGALKALAPAMRRAARGVCDPAAFGGAGGAGLPTAQRPGGGTAKPKRRRRGARRARAAPAPRCAARCARRRRTTRASARRRARGESNDFVVVNAPVVNVQADNVNVPLQTARLAWLEFGVAWRG